MLPSHTAEVLQEDLAGFQIFCQETMELREELRDYKKEEFDSRR